MKTLVGVEDQQRILGTQALIHPGGGRGTDIVWGGFGDPEHIGQPVSGQLTHHPGLGPPLVAAHQHQTAHRRGHDFFVCLHAIAA